MLSPPPPLLPPPPLIRRTAPPIRIFRTSTRLPPKRRANRTARSATLTRRAARQRAPQTTNITKSRRKICRRSALRAPCLHSNRAHKQTERQCEFLNEQFSACSQISILRQKWRGSSSFYFSDRWKPTISLSFLSATPSKTTAGREFETRGAIKVSFRPAIYVSRGGTKSRLSSLSNTKNAFRVPLVLSARFRLCAQRS